MKDELRGNVEEQIKNLFYETEGVYPWEKAEPYIDAILTLLEGEIHKAQLPMKLDDEFVGANGVQYKLVPAKKAKITTIGFVKNGVASCWEFDCLGEVPAITHIKDVSSSLVGGWTIQELELISAAENIVYDKATRTYKGEK